VPDDSATKLKPALRAVRLKCKEREVNASTAISKEIFSQGLSQWYVSGSVEQVLPGADKRKSEIES
jgi:hypothetical protein